MPTATTAGACAAWVDAADLSNFRSDIAGQVTDTTVLDKACMAATDVIYSLSGRQFPGQCTQTFRPIARMVGWTLSEWARYFEQLTGQGFSASWGRCEGDLHQWCKYPPQIDLGVFPLVAVDEVKIDGEVIPSNEYEIQSQRLLVRTRPTYNYSPTARWGWPTCQDFTLPDTEPGTFSVTATYGMSPPPGGVMACAVMASEIALSMSGLPNRLPARVTSVTRQGVTFAVLDPMSFLTQGKTGIYEVDLFLQSYNPQRQRRRPMVFSPDLGYTRTQPSS